MQLRAAATVLPDHTFARRVAVATCLLTAIAVGGAVGVVLSKPAPATKTRARELRSFDITYTQHQIDQYARTAFPRWAASRPAGACPQDLIEVNAYQPILHVVDPFGIPYRFSCQHGAFRVRAAGPDHAYDTADDHASQVP